MEALPLGDLRRRLLLNFLPVLLPSSIVLLYSLKHSTTSLPESVQLEVFERSGQFVSTGGGQMNVCSLESHRVQEPLVIITPLSVGPSFVHFVKINASALCWLASHLSKSAVESTILLIESENIGRGFSRPCNCGLTGVSPTVATRGNLMGVKQTTQNKRQKCS